MRRTQAAAEVILDSRLFSEYTVPGFRPVIPLVNDSTPLTAVYQGRKIYLRPVNQVLMGVESTMHGGEWLSPSLMWEFLVGQ